MSLILALGKLYKTGSVICLLQSSVLNTLMAGDNLKCKAVKIEVLLSTLEGFKECVSQYTFFKLNFCCVYVDFV